ncbi:putative disease resistance protein RGA1 [Syzygium oleosum]|uniref:putative disease resistance protein RGA1 n=1 Tax=Syzygium oleosum TaxID=219896 RepID=UPI0024BB86ED|nr:putative disease resistance protein RGA1 [Syzygium oleosum]XP_056161667.1 putative disease resistance protein RGA1 [Syzygium oleosum]XP_056161668.1 putative disease resistance protein RGA1 [Syzygium oleosum]XP_056161669.1 putative disease resistance protein RGA1 [Syzygium oleosum]
MAEAAIVSIVGKIITNLVTQSLDKVGKLWGVKHELEVLGDTVSTLRAVLDDAEKQSHQSGQIQVWLEKLKEAFYDAQDVLEEFNIEATRRELRGHNTMIKEVKAFFSSSNQLAFKLKMSYKIRAARERIEAINAGRRFHLAEHPVDLQVEREWRKREETQSFIREGDIRGRDDDKKTIIEFLLDSNVNENVSILPIVGIGGLGKTVLAQFVFNDEMVTRQFNLKIWVCVSNDFDMKKIVKNIIACATKKEPIEVSLEQLQREMRAAIDGKRYLLVLDDLWEKHQSTWLSLKTLLLGGARGSKILITTRLSSVVEITGTTPPHLLRGLSESASLDLLMQMACRKEEMQDPDMQAIGKEIVRKCSGVPLVIRTVGSLLFFKKTKLEWMHFKDKELQEVSRSEDDIKSVLRLSYNHLPSHLKQCFALCSLFPKDYEIKKQTLVNLWMAEGFIQPSNRSQHLEDIAHGYFMDLLWSNFFQDFQEDKETCKMHDLMHDLACVVAGNECGVALDDTKSINERARHLCVGDLPISHLKASPLRTYLSCMLRRISEVDLRQLIQSFKRLRVLDLHTTYVEKVPRSICKLKHLTYLDLSGNRELKRLPNSITRLQNLQTLNLNNCCALEELPRGIRKLVSLRNLDIDGCWKLGYLPRELGQLSSLHRLTRFILPKDKALAKDCCELGELNGLNDIRGSLRIENLGSVTDAEAESKAANLIGKQSLESLALEWGYFNTGDVANRDEVLLDGLRPHSSLQKLTINEYSGESFPRWMMDSLVSSLSNLVEVCFDNCGRCKSLPPLGQLPRLKSLSILELPELEDIGLGHSSTSIASFPRLLELDIQNCEKLKAMPLAPRLEELMLTRVHPALINMIVGLNKLKRLDIEEMEFLECVPEECWKSLASLEKLYIMDCHGLTSLSKAPPPPPPPLGRRHQSNQVDLDSSDSEELDLSNHGESSGGNSNNLILELHSLRSVRLWGLPKLASLPRWLLQASNLEHLSIRYCSELDKWDFDGVLHHSLRSLWIESLPKLESLPQWLLQAGNLERLDIWDCDELDICKDESGNLILDFDGRLHQSLRSLWIRGLPKLASLPQWLLQLSNLEHLQISRCSNLKALPEQIEALQSLQLLEIINCPSLTSLPEGMRRLASLTHLIIYECPELERRCKRDGGEDWDKIAHIPDIQPLY